MIKGILGDMKGGRIDNHTYNHCSNVQLSCQNRTSCLTIHRLDISTYSATILACSRVLTYGLSKLDNCVNTYDTLQEVCVPSTL